MRTKIKAVAPGIYEADILLDRLVPVQGQEMDCTEIARLAGISKQRVDQILKCALAKIRQNPRLLALL